MVPMLGVEHVFFFLYLYLCYKCHYVRWCAILALWENATSSMPCIHSLWSTASLRSMLDSHAALLLLQKPQGKQTFKIFIFIINLSRSDFSNGYYNSPTMIRKSRSYSEPWTNVCHEQFWLKKIHCWQRLPHRTGKREYLSITSPGNLKNKNLQLVCILPSLNIIHYLGTLSLQILCCLLDIP